MFVLCLVCAKALCGDLKLIQGDKKFFKTAEGNASLEFVWDGATFDDKEPLTAHYTNLKELEKVAWKWFLDEFNERNKKVKVVSLPNEEVKYKFTVKVTKMDQYFKVTGFIPAMATKAWGTLTITDITSNEVVFVSDFAKVDGGANPSPDGCFGDCFKDLARQLSKFK